MHVSDKVKMLQSDMKKDNNVGGEIRLTFMLWALVTVLVISPVCREFTTIKIILDIGFTLVFISGVYAVVHSRILTLLTLVSAVPMLFFIWERLFPALPDMSLAGPLSAIFFSSIIIKVIYDQIKSASRVSVEMIHGGLTIYLLLGFAWAMLYKVLFFLNPASFSGIENVPADEILNVFLYFSFVTLSTLGYGDISPTIELSRSLAVLEAMTGQIYLVVVVAWLVGIKVAQDLQEK